jgi:hypothetical protein
MLIIKNVLSDDVMRDIQIDISSKLKERCWGLSDFTWEPATLQGVTGNCATSTVESPISEKIERNIKKHLPQTYTQLQMYYYIWTRNSGIASHNDAHPFYSFGATLYLNSNWDENWGGLFVYDDNGIKKVIAPEFNTMVVNDKLTQHRVTSVSPLATKMRMSIQIWAIK